MGGGKRWLEGWADQVEMVHMEDTENQHGKLEFAAMLAEAQGEVVVDMGSCESCYVLSCT